MPSGGGGRGGAKPPSAIDLVVGRVQKGMLVAQRPRTRFSRTLIAPHIFAPVGGSESPPGVDADPGPDFLALRLGAEELLGLEATWSAVAERLRRYGLSQVLQVVSWVSAVLSATPAARADPVRQQMIAVELFGDRRAHKMFQIVSARRAQEVREGRRAPIVTVFDELQIINLVKASLIEQLADVAVSQPLAEIGEALLMVGDLIETGPGSIADCDVSTIEGREDARYYLFVNTLFHAGDNPVHVLVRSCELYLTERPSLQKTDCYIDLPALVKKATGLEPDQVWAILFALVGHGFQLERDPSAVIRVDSYFTEHFTFSKADAERFFSLIARDASALRHAARLEYSATAIKPYHMLPLAKTPLIIVEGRAFEPSRTLIFECLGRGLYHRLLNACEDRKERARFQKFMGIVFEDYVGALLDRACKSAKGGQAPTYLAADTLRSRVRGTRRKPRKACDAAIVFRDAVLLIEIKAGLFSLPARTGGSRAEYESRLDDLYAHAGKQLHDTIQGIEERQLEDVGLRPSQIRCYYPIVVTLENIPTTAPVFDRVFESVRAAGLLSDPEGKVRLLQLMEVGELELLEVALTRDGRNIPYMVQRKIEKGPALSFTNFWHLDGERDLLASRNSYLEARWRDTTDRAIAFLRSRTRTGEQDLGTL